MTTAIQTGPAVAETLSHYLGRSRAALWLTGAECGVSGNVIVIRTPYVMAKSTLERCCAAELRAASEVLLGEGASWRIEVIEGRRVPVSTGRTVAKELF